MTIGWYNANEYVSVSVEKHCCYCKRPLWIGITACWIDGVGEDGEYLSLLLRILRCLIMNFMWLYQQDESLRVWDWWMDSLKERIWMWVIWIRSPHLPSSATKIRHEQADLPSKKKERKKKKENRKIENRKDKKETIRKRNRKRKGKRKKVRKERRRKKRGPNQKEPRTMTWARWKRWKRWDNSVHSLGE